MATSTRPTNQKTIRPISPPDWSAEALVTHRAVWEIAAMAGNVTPQLAALKAKREIDPEWKNGYERIVRLMTNALSSSRGPVADHVYYQHHRSGNAALMRNLSKLRQVRVEVASAIEFIWNVYGECEPPEGLRVVHQRLRLQDANVPKQSATEPPKQSIGPVEQPTSVKGSAHRDQRLANATKEIKRLHALVYILSRELYGFLPSSDSPPPTLTVDVLASIKSAGLERREGFGPNSIQTLLQQSFHHFFQSKQ